MTIFSGLAKENHLSEFGEPLETQAGVKTPAQRKALALANLGLSTTSGNALEALAAGKKLAFGSAAFDGSNPTSVAHGLTTVVAVVTNLQGAVAPGDNTSVITYNVNGANIDFYAWKNTGGTDPTLVASTGTETFSWIAIGT